MKIVFKSRKTEIYIKIHLILWYLSKGN